AGQRPAAAARRRDFDRMLLISSPAREMPVEPFWASKPGQRVAGSAAEASAEVASSLHDALATAGAFCDSILVDRVADRPLARAPREALDALEAGAGGLLWVQPGNVERGAR